MVEIDKDDPGGLQNGIVIIGSVSYSVSAIVAAEIARLRYLVAPQPTCGHPHICMIQSRDGRTHHCGWCEEIAAKE